MRRKPGNSARAKRADSRSPIVVEDLDEQLDASKLEAAAADERWSRAGRVLRVFDPDCYRKMFALAEGYAKLVSDVDEGTEAFAARRRLINAQSNEAN